ncbi:ABC transporter permease [Geopsychrobacter electrodiphilus]|uniref:ABC transporter permease n=1 Tax=Geopsychrobacter electrodiphilus TaxID=225196 RepID=UPI000381AEBC|nr:ABC transporter permease [Geopsychrobacter electrodiphilus]
MRFITCWLKGLLTYRPERLLATMAGIGLTIATLAALGTFIASSSVSMTKRAIGDVPIDWQVLVSGDTSVAAFTDTLAKTTRYTALQQVTYADTAGFEASTDGTVQTTGPGQVLGISDAYRQAFPSEIRPLTGARQGVLVAQQTAANLHVKAGDRVLIKRIDLPPVAVTIAGIVDLPDADALFQVVGALAGTAPTAPPDNVLLLPGTQWHRLFDPQASSSPDTVSTQYHVKIGHDLPTNPNDAYLTVKHLANNLEARNSGGISVADNLAARLAGTRADAMYARVLFLFLGLPGALLAILLTLSVAASGKKHRLHQQSLLRVRGASRRQILKFELGESTIVGIGGVVCGGILFLLAGTMTQVGADSSESLGWLAGASLAGFLLALISTLYPAWQQARHFSVAASRDLLRRSGKPLWQKTWLDIILLGLAFFEYWRTASSGYQVVLAPEGVAQISVHYEAFIAPLCLWIGGILLAARLGEDSLEHGRQILLRLLRPLAPNLTGPVVASLIRQRRLISRGMIMVALAISFAVSTATFNTTYNFQSRVDAELTNGADVAIKGSSAAPPGSKLAELKALPGVAAIQPMLHRFAYVGKDLQDIYGINPDQIGTATPMSNAYFAGGNAKATLALLAKNPDGLLVSEETRRDFQLRPGDQLNLRLQLATDHQYHLIPFHFIGVVREFPTAPKDSFLVANADYLTRQTGITAQEIVLIRTAGDAAQLAAEARKTVSSLAGVKVTDLGSAQRLISSSLTSVDLHGLTRLELILALFLVMGATGLILALGLTERRRNFAILEALGASSRQLGAFIWSEILLILVGGGVIGTFLGLGIAQILVKVLTAVFDPPPEHLYIPCSYLSLLAVVAIVSTILATWIIRQVSHRPVVEELRNL